MSDKAKIECSFCGRTWESHDLGSKSGRYWESPLAGPLVQVSKSLTRIKRIHSRPEKIVCECGCSPASYCSHPQIMEG